MEALNFTLTNAVKFLSFINFFISEVKVGYVYRQIRRQSRLREILLMQRAIKTVYMALSL